MKSSLIIVGLFLFAGNSAVQAGAKVYVGQQRTGQQVSMDNIDHSTWDTLVKRYVDSDGMVDYAAWKASQADVRALDQYLDLLSTASRQVTASRQSRLAFWINAYNAVTIRGILREYPTTSIRNHTARIWGYNIWHDYQIYIGGGPISLDQIEHEVLRKMGEPRIHFAIVCAAISCPRLLNEAYVPDRVNEQLENNSRDFFTRSRNFRYDARNKTFFLSSILDWFGEDFGSNQSVQLRRIAKWLPETARSAAERNSVRVRHLDYDWNLNAQSTKRVARR